ncbi:MAG: hypothetical protein GY909_15210 [Oligoflexia bacterium]|nr:hypothetical protein [Oligoflexia bacterium]
MSDVVTKTVEKEDEKISQTLLRMLYIFSCFIIAMLIGYFHFDSAPTYYSCPSDLDALGGPVTLTRIDKITDPKQIKILIVNVVRKHINALHPSTTQNLENKLTWAIENSKDDLKEDYKARLSGIEKIKEDINKNIYTSIHVTDLNKIAVERVRNKNIWVVSVPAVYTKRNGNSPGQREYIEAKYYLEFSGVQLGDTEGYFALFKREYISKINKVTNDTKKVD